MDKRLHKAALAFNEGRLDDAENALADAAVSAPELQGGALHIRALIHHRRGDTRTALDLLVRAVDRLAGPEQAAAAFDAGRLCEATGDTQRAEAFFAQAVAGDPAPARYWHRWGRMLIRMNRREEGVRALREAVDRAPEDAAVWFSLGVALGAAGALDGAVEAYERVLRLDPVNAEAQINLGAGYLQQGRLEAALESLQTAAANPEQAARAHGNLGTVYMRMDRLGDALAAYRRAAEADPKNATALANASIVLAHQVRHEESRRAIEAAIRADSSPAGQWHNLLFSHYYRPDLDPALCADQARKWAEGVEGATPAAVPRHRVPIDPDRTLRVGFVSPDFYRHPVSAFLMPLFREADRERLTLHCFAQMVVRDAVTERIRSLADGWHEIQAMGPQEAAQLIRTERIDVLIDLAGHTSGNRLDIFPLKPAPVQVTYLGYPGTTGLRSVDYRLTDVRADPPGRTEAFHSEALLRLAPGFLCFEPPADAPEVGPLPAETSGYVTFGSFNNLLKLNKPLIALWADLLARIPDSKLFIKSRPLGDPATRRRVQRLFGDAGISPNRLIVAGRIEDTTGHLDAYNRMDIALDTHPYNGTTTTCEALWMGVPTVTRAGASHVSRVGASLLGMAGLEDLVARDASAYVETAAGLARDPSRLRGLRMGLRDRVASSPLTDAPAFAREFERVLRSAWRDYCERARKRSPPLPPSESGRSTGAPP